MSNPTSACEPVGFEVAFYAPAIPAWSDCGRLSGGWQVSASAGAESNTGAKAPAAAVQPELAVTQPAAG
ncbi:hypothetical protein FCJ61_21810 [Burkholderia metallica]|uniref:hypothetical protein n=1 Tax=Burkholderia metallica TaxID=488729 RepID=UPI00157B6207|nr:hypothetical protein [Burkholderia metallica]NTZ85561.1 hypothetical protein [Burkholderia metallica]